MIRRVVPFIAFAALATASVPATAQGAQVAPRDVQATAVTPVGVQAATTALPGTDDPAWEKVFEDGFTTPHTATTDAHGTWPAVFTVNDRVIWRNRGSVKTMDPCATVTSGKPGILKVKAVVTNPGDDTYPWRCRITSEQTFSGGVHIFAAKVKVHTSTGHLSSFWLNSNAGTPNEIDVIENAGLKSRADGCQGSDTIATNRSEFYGVNHAYYSKYEDPGTNTQKTGKKHCLSEGNSRAVQDDAFHVFHAEWAPGEYIKFYIDGNLSTTFGSKYAIDSPLNAILTNIEDENVSAEGFEVDWVKVWKKNVAPTPPAPAPCDNDCWRGRLGVYSYSWSQNTSATDPRLARAVFDRRFYLETYPDVRTWAEGKVAAQGGTIFQHAEWHWLNYGISWGRSGSATLDPAYYLSVHPDVAQAYGGTNYAGAIFHYVQFGQGEGRRGSVTFDPGFYRARYADVAAAGGPDYAVYHFTHHGMDEGRQGSAEFAPAWYLGSNPDLQSAYGANNYRAGMTHWLNRGRAEGRPGAP